MEKPKLTSTPAPVDHVLDIAGWLLLLFMWAHLLSRFAHLPETVPVHFDAAGMPDGTGSKKTLLFLPVVASVIYIGLTILNQFPHLFNFPIKITESNAINAYRIAGRMLRFLKLALLLIFLYMMMASFRVAMGEQNGLGIWFLAAGLAFIFIPVFISMYQIWKLPKE